MSDEPRTPASTAGADEDQRGDEQVGSDETRRMRRALAEIRREGWKVAVIYAAFDAALVTLLSNAALAVAGPAFVPAAVPIPAAVVDVLRGTVGLPLVDPSVAGGTVVGVALGVIAFAIEVSVRVRRPLVEQFEAANPGLRESLRTARDAVEDGRRSRIARRLYDDVLAELREASSVDLLDLRRLTATVVVIALVSVATIQLAAVDVSLLGSGGGPADGPPDGDRQSDFDGLRNGSSILGDPEDVPTGQESMEAVVDTSGSGGGDGSESVAAYENSGFDGSGSYESQRAGFSESDQLEDAELIREYNLRIREGDGG